MRKEDATLLESGMLVRIGDRLLGEEIYGEEDPELYKKYLGCVATVNRVGQEGSDRIMVDVTVLEYNQELTLFIEEIDRVLEEEDTPLDMVIESQDSLNQFLGLTS